MYQSDSKDNSDISVIGQFDGNVSLNNNDCINQVPPPKKDKFSIALNLPIVAA